MKTLLKISICLNLALAVGLVLALLNGPQRITPPARPVGAEIRLLTNAVVVPATPQAASSAAESKPFRWSQLGGKDYPTYVKNLRAIGCPEKTLRAIVTADVVAAFAGRIQEVEQEIAEVRGKANSWTNQMAAASAGTEAALKSELDQIPEEEAAEINELLGVGQIAAAQPARAQRQRPQPPDEPIAPPLVFQPVDLAALNLDPGQLQAIQDLRQSFMAKIGGTNQDPNDPAYMARWQQAQPETDELMHGLLGDAAFGNYQLQAFAQSQAQAEAQAQANQPDNPQPSEP
jgi:hypothetical protein